MSIWITLLNVKKVCVPARSTYFWRACQKNDLLPWKSFGKFFPKQFNRILYCNTVFPWAEWKAAPKLYLNQRFFGKLYNLLTSILCQNDEWFRFRKRTINVKFSDTIAMCNFCDSISFHKMGWFVHRTSVFWIIRLVVLLHSLDEIEIPTQWRWFEIGIWSKQLHTMQVIFNQWHAVIVYIRIWFDHVIGKTQLFGKIHPCLNQTTLKRLLLDASASCSTHWVCYWFLWILMSAAIFLFLFVSHVPKTDDID